MKSCWLVVLLLTVGCATPRVVQLDTGRGGPIAYTPSSPAPVEVDEEAFRQKGHRGPHSREYHATVFERLGLAMKGCEGVAQCRAALVQELQKIALDLMTSGSNLRRFVTKD
ncbi:AHH domain-containing protein [Corallococcus sp. bb12-1]|uniref:AHH domain-containing protein n=1 Tax=Corallococcus sp. bb12-1 TaxID=2996784 RepID=UPI00227187D1|nr:AHH domain-containing protein [Corallococcus sp. bb12-1]MCY1040798.1 AHH domain-containing protein [Corallococcus sp. bb12-1]